MTLTRLPAQKDAGHLNTEKRRWRRRLGIPSALMVLGVLVTATPAWAANFVFAGGQFTTNPSNVRVTTADGLWTTMQTIGNMDVPTTGSAPAVTIPAGQNINGHNTRFGQIGATNSSEFFGIGYTAGTAGQPGTPGYANTGFNASRAVYKNAYWDGYFCPNGASSCDYGAGLWDRVSAGDTHAYQIQRNQLSGGNYGFRFWFDDVLKNTRGSLMTQGTVTVSSENGANTGTQRLNMTGDWTNPSFHLFGSTSSTPPGAYNYARPGGLTSVQQPSGCSVSTNVSGTTLYAVNVSGRC